MGAAFEIWVFLLLALMLYRLGEGRRALALLPVTAFGHALQADRHMEEPQWRPMPNDDAEPRNFRSNGHINHFKNGIFVHFPYMQNCHYGHHVANMIMFHHEVR